MNKEELEKKTGVKCISSIDGIKRFSVCVMNPPYSGNLHLKFLEKVIKLSKNVISIQPATWANINNYNAPKGKWREKLKGKIKEFEFIPHKEANEIFGTGNAIEDLSIMWCVPSGGTFDIENWGFKNANEKSIIQKLNVFKEKHDIMYFNKAVTIEEYGSVNGRLWGQPNKFARKEFDVPVYQWHGGKNCFDAVVMSDERAQKRLSYTMRFKNETERKNFLDSLKTTFMDYYFKTIVEAGDGKISAYMFRFKDYSKQWDNKRFCEYFKITGFISDTRAEKDSEWEEILKTMNII